MIPHEAIQIAVGQQPTHVAAEIGQAIFAAVATVEFVLRHRATRTHLPHFAAVPLLAFIIFSRQRR